MTKNRSIAFAYEPYRMFTAMEPFVFGREPTLRRMPDGSLFSLVYTGGPREPDQANCVAAIHSRDDGESWSEPEVLFPSDRLPTWGTEVFTETERPFLAFHTFQPATHYMEIRAYFSYTEDSGKTWSQPVSVPGVPANFSVRQGKVLSDGSWLFPVYWKHSPYWNSREQLPWDIWRFHAGVIKSSDQGRSYTLHGCVTTDLHAWEPEITELEPGHLRMYIRNREALWESDSRDYGLTWSVAHPGEIPNPGTKVTVYQVRGRHVMFNNIPTKPQERGRLEMWVSSDHCRTWPHRVTLAELKSGGGPTVPQVAYPHGFADDRTETFYLAVDSISEFNMLKIPYRDILKNPSLSADVGQS